MSQSTYFLAFDWWLPDQVAQSELQAGSGDDPASLTATNLLTTYRIEPRHTIKRIYNLFSMWQVLEHRRVARRLSKRPVDILKRYEKWKDIVAISGPEGLRLIKDFRDDALKGKWQAHRSSRLGAQYRVIYVVEEQNVVVKVIDLTAHDYRRKAR